MHGEGVYIYATGRVYSGIFKEGDLQMKKDKTLIKNKHD